jgi:DNA-binding NtrC family response regulator
LRELGPRLVRRQVGITEDAVGALERYEWPGNVRELINVLERAVLLCDGEVTTAELPDAIRTPISAADDVRARAERTYADAIAAVTADFEREYFADLLARTRGRVGEVARRSGLSPRTVYDKLRRLQLRKEAFRAAGTR